MKTRHASATTARSDRRTHSGAAKEINSRRDEKKDVLDWESGVVLMALIKGRPIQGSASEDGRFLFISPSINAFDELAEQRPFISELWLLVANTEGPGVSYVDRIEEVASWTAHTAHGRPLLVLRGQTGHLLGVDNDGLFTLQASSVHWCGEGCYRGAPDPTNTSTG